MSDDLLKLAAVLGLVVVNGVFVAAEFALVSVRPTRIDQLIEQGNRMARVVKRAMDDPNRFISAAQVGITMASLGLGWVAEPTLAHLFEPIFGPVFGENARISSHIVAGILAYFIITLLHIVLGEQVPKMIALQRAEATILATAAPVTWISVPFRPMIALLYWLTGLTLRPLNLQWQGEHHLVYSEDELKMLVTASQQSGYLEQSEQEMINRVFTFADHFTEEVMVPRTEMEALQVDASFDEVVRTIASSGHARYPVYGESLDDVLGIFHAKDLYRVLEHGQQHRFSLGRMLHDAMTVPDTMPLDELLAQMKRKRTHIAIVVDEYGGTAGMTTLEDVLERIVGDVHDEFNMQSDDIEPLENGDIRIAGLLSIEEFNERFGIKLDEPFYNTVGGFVFGQLGRRPEIGDEIAADEIVLTVNALDGLRIDRLILRRIQDETRGEVLDSALQDASR
ncbi:MAG: HlyC/CorC family transporter [Thermomicrobiales bacterium]|nr:HlyC/CorC family transporter [Thermomicrobiales bacterium]